MAKLLTSVSDTPISGVTAPSITVPVLNYEKDFRVKSDSNTEVVLVNTTAAMDEEELLRVGYTEIKDIYRSANLPTPLNGNTAGVSILVQLTKKIKIDSEVSGSPVTYAPISAHLVMKVPRSEAMDQKAIEAILARMLGGLYEKGTSRVVAICKGAVSPIGL